jgi:hypothetical protein
MTANERVVLALLWRWEGTYASELAVGLELLTPSGQNLMTIGLMTHVPDDTILGSIEHIVQGDGKLHHAKARCQMARVHRELLHNVPTQFFAYLRQLIDTQATQVGGKLYIV